jgi:hypothetical protein
VFVLCKLFHPSLTNTMAYFKIRKLRTKKAL